MAAYNFFEELEDERIVTQDENMTCNAIFRCGVFPKQLIIARSPLGARWNQLARDRVN